MRPLATLISFLVLQAFVEADAHSTDASQSHVRNSTRTPDQRLEDSSQTNFSDISFKNLTLHILPHVKNSGSSPPTTTTTASPHNNHHHRHHHGHSTASPVKTTPLPPPSPKSAGGSKSKDDSMSRHSSGSHQPFQCTPTVPRVNLRLQKMAGTWYPMKLSKATINLWTESLQKKHKIPANDTDCFSIEFKEQNKSMSELTAITLALHKADKSINLSAILLGDEKHPKGSKWAIAWPNGEDTLTSVVAAGVVGKERNQYSWLLTVDCDINGIVESDWAVMARVPEGISNATLTAILAILEGLKGIKVENAITFQSEHCHNK